MDARFVVPIAGAVAAIGAFAIVMWSEHAGAVYLAALSGAFVNCF